MKIEKKAVCKTHAPVLAGIDDMRVEAGAEAGADRMGGGEDLTGAEALGEAVRRRTIFLKTLVHM